MTANQELIDAAEWEKTTSELVRIFENLKNNYDARQIDEAYNAVMGKAQAAGSQDKANVKWRRAGKNTPD